MSSSEWFRSTDLWVMGPARFHCATVLMHDPCPIENNEIGQILRFFRRGWFPAQFVKVRRLIRFKNYSNSYVPIIIEVIDERGTDYCARGDEASCPIWAREIQSHPRLILPNFNTDGVCPNC